MAHQALSLNKKLFGDKLIDMRCLELFLLIKSRNKKKGKLAFSTEKNILEGCQLEQSGRYSHSKRYIESLCKKFDYSISFYSEVDLRKEKGKFLTGGLYLLSF